MEKSTKSNEIVKQLSAAIFKLTKNNTVIDVCELLDKTYNENKTKCKLIELQLLSLNLNMQNKMKKNINNTTDNTLINLYSNINFITLQIYSTRLVNCKINSISNLFIQLYTNISDLINIELDSNTFNNNFELIIDSFNIIKEYLNNSKLTFEIFNSIDSYIYTIIDLIIDILIETENKNVIECLEILIKTWPKLIIYVFQKIMRNIMEIINTINLTYNNIGTKLLTDPTFYKIFTNFPILLNFITNIIELIKEQRLDNNTFLNKDDIDEIKKDIKKICQYIKDDFKIKNNINVIFPLFTSSIISLIISIELLIKL